MGRLKKNEFKCAMCERVFARESSWSDEEAMKEYIKTFPKSVEHDAPIVMVCDECYQQMKKIKSPRKAEKEYYGKKQTTKS